MFPVLPDQLDVLWDVQAKPAQHFHYKICEPVCHAENSVQGHFSAGGVVRKELFECVIGFVVAYYFQLTMESAGEAAVLKAGFALVRFIADGGAFAQKGNIFTSKIRQLFRSQLSACEIIARHTGDT